MHFTGQTAAQGGSVQCMHAIDTERSPGLPSLMVTTRRRLMPQGTSFSFLQAVTQALQSMQRSASQRNFMRAMEFFLGIVLSGGSDLAKCGLWLLHAGRGIVAISRQRVYAFAKHERIGALWIPRAQIGPFEPAGEMIGHPRNALADTLGHERLHARARAILRAGYPDPSTVRYPALARV